MLIFERDSGRFVGSSGLHHIDWEVGRFEIGYWARSADRGQGFITEAVTAITQYAFQQLNARRVEIRTDATNMRSLKIAANLGYQLEATLRHNQTKPNCGALSDTLVYVRFDGVGLPDVEVSWSIEKPEQQVSHGLSEQ